jgi:DNA-binding NarL/FixJ family response regulator
VDRRIRVLIADDQVLFAEGLRYVFQGISPEIEVIGICTDGEKTLAFTERDQPDVILMDVRMPLMDGVEATKLIHRKYPQVRIVMLTTFDDDEYVHFAVKYGAAGYLLKSIRPQDLVHSIQAVMGGAVLFAKGVTEKITRTSQGELGDLDLVIANLTNREREVLNLVMQLFNNRQIEERMNLSEQSVRNYMHSLYDSFGVKDRMELIQRLKDIWLLARR